MVNFLSLLFYLSPQSPSIPPSSICPGPQKCLVGNLVRARLSLQACQRRSAVIWCEVYASVPASQGQGLVTDVFYSSVSYVFSFFLHCSFCFDK